MSEPDGSSTGKGNARTSSVNSPRIRPIFSSSNFTSLSAKTRRSLRESIRHRSLFLSLSLKFHFLFHTKADRLELVVDKFHNVSSLFVILIAENVFFFGVTKYMRGMIMIGKRRKMRVSRDVSTRNSQVRERFSSDVEVSRSAELTRHFRLRYARNRCSKESIVLRQLP